ncbi:MAG: PPE family protein [Mycobacteriaceae bacterium]|nr:PPE family protein [Mycobacteriaceae bacterium]
MVEFEFFPPEVNSALIYGGAGASSLFAAAAAWDGLAADLGGAASSFSSVVSTLAGGAWSGPTSAAMAGAAAPYVSWLATAAAQAAGAAAQVRAVATSFEAAQTATVHPVAVLANRTQLLTLIATNILGLNTPAIAATEFDYGEMWAQDVGAMSGYQAGAMSAAAQLVPFSLPPVDLAGLGVAATGLVADAADSAAVIVPAISSGFTTASPMLQSGSLLLTPIGYAMSPMQMLLSMAMQGATGSGAGAAAAGAAAAVPVDAAKLVGDTSAIPKGLGASGLGALSGGMGQARLMGAMSVPSTWPGAMEAGMSSGAMAGMARAGMPGAAMAAEEAAMAGGMSPMPMPMPMGAGAGGMPGMGGMMRGGAGAHVVQNRPTVVPRTGV